jgi:hypothetical protein
MDPIPDPLLLRKSGSPGNRTRDLWICSQELWPLDYRGGNFYTLNSDKTVFGAYSLSNPVSTRGYIPGGKDAGACSWPLISI